MAQIIIAKHRKGSVGDVLLNFRGEFTRFQDPQDAAAAPVEEGGEIVGSRMNGGGRMVVRYHRRLQRICLSKVRVCQFFTQNWLFSPNSCTELTFWVKKHKNIGICYHFY